MDDILQTIVQSECRHFTAAEWNKAKAELARLQARAVLLDDVMQAVEDGPGCEGVFAPLCERYKALKREAR